MVDSPTSQIPAGSIDNPAALAGKVALTDIDPGEELAIADFGPAPVATPGPGRRAFVIPSPREFGGRITAGSYVEVWVAKRGKSREVYAKMRVLGTSGGNVALVATVSEAGKLVYLSQQNNARLVLRLRK